MRAYVGDLLAGRETVRTVVFAERLGALTEDASAPVAAAGEFTLSRVGSAVRVEGLVAARVPLVCGGCLASFVERVEVSIDEEFSRAGGEAVAPAGEPLGVEAFQGTVEPGDVIDLTEVVRQHLVLALPIAPRCTPECRGLCPRCGADLNAGPCGCRTVDVDPRLRALEAWRTGRPRGRAAENRGGRRPSADAKERDGWD